MLDEPKHYTQNGMSPLECFKYGLISHDEFVGFCKGNIIKYLCRGGLKDGESELNDYLKALDYMTVLVEITKNK